MFFKFLVFITWWCLLEVDCNEIRLSPFKQLAHGLRSGPILIIDEKTFFITNLHYDGKGPDAHFWVGNGTNGPDENGMRVADPKNHIKTLPKYEGQDIYLTLPDHLTVKNIDYLGIWCIQYKHNFGYTTIPNELGNVSKANGYHEYTKDHQYIARLPKCCPEGQVKSFDGCLKKQVEGKKIPIYWGNMTYLQDVPKTNVVYSSYFYYPKCEHFMYSLNPQRDSMYLLTNGLLVCDGELITKDNFCVEFGEMFDLDDNFLGWNETIFCCTPEKPEPEFLNTILVVCIYISSVFLILSSAVFVFIKKARNTRGFNVVGYTVFMASSFVCLATARILYLSGHLCAIFGFLYQFLLVSAFCWLFCLTYESFHRVVYYNKEHKKNRFYIYAAFAIALPSIAVILSLFLGKEVPYTDTGLHDRCWFRSDKRLVVYYLPITISILLNIVYIIRTWRYIKQADQSKDPVWMLGRKDLKNVFRSCYLILIVMALCWFGEIVSYFLETTSGFWMAIDIINSLQGVFVFLIFVMHNPVINILQRKYPRLFTTKADINPPESMPICGNVDGAEKLNISETKEIIN